MSQRRWLACAWTGTVLLAAGWAAMLASAWRTSSLQAVLSFVLVVGGSVLTALGVHKGAGQRAV